VYEQLRAQIATMAATGTLEPGARLPTIRQLAADLGLAKGTVSKAYDELLRAGVATSDGRRGTRIAEARGIDLSRQETTAQLHAAAEQFAVVVRQLGRSDQDARSTLDAALRRLPKH